MKSRKRYGRKVKHTRTNLYRKRKTRGQRIFGTVLLTFAVCAAAFLGYCLGKPLLEFFDKSANREEPQWTPPATTAPEREPEETIASEAAASAAEEQPVSENRIYAVTAPAASLQNQTALVTFVTHAKEQGYNAVVLPLKDEKGYFHYASPAALSRGAGLAVSELTAEEIAAVCEGAEMRVIGTVSALADDAGCDLNMDMCYKMVYDARISWLDFDYDPPIFWADPSKEATQTYLKEIIGELTNAGIEVMLKELVFPALDEYDRKYIAAPYFEESRSAMLLPLVTGNAPVEMRAEDIIGEKPGRTAELLREKEFTERGNTIAVRISREKFSTEDGWPADAAGLIEDILARVRLKTGGLEVLPVIEREGFSEADTEAVKRLLLDTGYIVD